MSVSKYQMFLKTVECGSFSRALEDELGITLLSRNRGGVVLTADGRALLPRVEALCAAHHALMQSAADLKGLDAGRHNLDGGIRHHALIYRHLAPGQVPCHLIRHTDARHKTVGHNHDFFVLHPAQAFQCALTKKDPSAEAEFLHVSPLFPLLQSVCAAGISPPPAA